MKGMKRWLSAGMLFFLLMLALGGAAAEEETGAEAGTLPQVEIVSLEKTGIQDIQTKDEVLRARLTYTDGEDSFTRPVTIRWQGNSTLQFDKKNFTIRLYADETFQDKQKAALNPDWGAHSKYCLKANYTDATLARNIVANRLAADINRAYRIFPKAPRYGQTDGFPVELTLDGSYWGIYTWNIPKDDWMLNLDEKNENHLLFLAENPLADSVIFREEASWKTADDWKLEEGPADTQEQMAASYEKLNRAIRFVMDSTDEEFRERFGEYFNLDAALNYYCFACYTNTSDNMGKNLLLATMDGKVWYPVLYDLDTAFGLYYNGEGIYSPTNRREDFNGGNSLLWERLVKLFPQELYDRYQELRKTYLNEAYIMSLFEAFEEGIPEEALRRNLEKWPGAPGQEFGTDSVREHLQAREGYVDGVFSALPHARSEYEDERLLFRLEEPYQ